MLCTVVACCCCHPDLRVREQEDVVSQTRFINPQGLSKPLGYTHVVETAGSARLIYIAGQLGIDREGKLSRDFRLQAVQTFENLKTALAAVGAQFQHVVKFNNYLADIKHLPIFRQVRDSYLSDTNRPASTTIAISGLAHEGAMLEIEAVAVLPVPSLKETAVAGRHARSVFKAGRSRDGKRRKHLKGRKSRIRLRK
jgi:2-iminobutanoate/2-iminopropanoate deaminase